MDETQRVERGMLKRLLLWKKITLTPRGQRCHGNTAPAFEKVEKGSRADDAYSKMQTYVSHQGTLSRVSKFPCRNFLVVINVLNRKAAVLR